MSLEQGQSQNVLDLEDETPFACFQTTAWAFLNVLDISARSMIWGLYSCFLPLAFLHLVYTETNLQPLPDCKTHCRHQLGRHIQAVSAKALYAH
ncbi:MAG: hypothetical protein AMK69_26145 [Nitrospira bacterium SG8_3]|nr:MAG: hypothetical protein AMK69_26145 [Nitrospira bacterium SG8_3]